MRGGGISRGNSAGGRGLVFEQEETIFFLLWVSVPGGRAVCHEKCHCRLVFGMRFLTKTASLSTIGENKGYLHECVGAHSSTDVHWDRRYAHDTIMRGDSGCMHTTVGGGGGVSEPEQAKPHRASKTIKPKQSTRSVPRIKDSWCSVNITYTCPLTLQAPLPQDNART